MDRKSANLGENDVVRIREIVQAYTAEGFVWFYYWTQKDPLPDHCVEWIYEYFEALSAGENLCVEAFRGSLKTTIFSVLLTVYQIGCYPELETIITQSNDDKAFKSSSQIADIIATNPGFRFLFPHVRPDIAAGWGAHGYEVMRMDMPYGAWRKLRGRTPSLMAAGYKGSSILSHHPTGHGILDDVNDHKNTRSSRELNMVITTVDKEIVPAFDRVKMRIDVFTPWVPGDVGDRAKKSPSSRKIKTPLFRLDQNGKMTDVPTWPEVFPEKRIEKLREDTAPVEFAQMYLLDLEATRGAVLKREWLHYYPYDELNKKLPVAIGVDYASVAKTQELKGRDHFALAVVEIHPEGFGVLIDGYFGHVSRSEAEEIGISWGVDYQDRLLFMGVEKQGKGEEYYNVMLRSAPFPVRDMTPGNMSKGKRFENQMAPLFKQGKVRVSNEPDNRFLDQFLGEWLAWDGTGHYFDDCLDAVYYAVALIKGFIKPSAEDIPGVRSIFDSVTKNPLFKFAKR